MTDTDTPDEIEYDRMRNMTERNDWHEVIMGKSMNGENRADHALRVFAGLAAPTDAAQLRTVMPAPTPTFDTRDEWSVQIGNKAYDATEYAALAEHFAGVARARERELPEWMENHILVGFHRGGDANTIEELIDNLPEDAAKLQQLIGMTGAEAEGYEVADVVVVNTLEGADGITSLDPTVEGPLANPLFSNWMSDAEKTARQSMHRPVIDIDFPAALIPSSTPGHYHLYLDKLMPTDDFVALMQTLADVGIVEEGYAYASIERGYSSVRLPWVHKEQS